MTESLSHQIRTVIGKVGMTHFEEGLKLKEIANAVENLESNCRELRTKLIAEEKAFDKLEAISAPPSGES